MARNEELEGVEKEKHFRLVYGHLDMREPGVSGQCQIVPCGMNPSTRRNVEGDETRLECGTTQVKEGCEYLSKESGFCSAGSNGGS